MLVEIPSFRTARDRNGKKILERSIKRTNKKEGVPAGYVPFTCKLATRRREETKKFQKRKKVKITENSLLSKPSESDGLPGGYRASNPTDPWRHRPAGPCSAWRRSDPAWKKTAPDSRSLRLARKCRWLRPVQVVNFFFFFKAKPFFLSVSLHCDRLFSLPRSF